MKNKWFGGFLASLILAGSALAGDANLGAQKAAVCGACHGMTGSSVNPEWPNLAGQHEAYIVAQLQNFKHNPPLRSNPLMTPMAAPLQEADMHDLGAHFSQQTPTGLEADPSNWKEGEKIYRGGDASRGIPACIACHGPQGRGNGPAKYPALRAQHSVYTYNQLKAFKDGTRKSAGNDIMQVVTERMTDEEMRALASYVQGLR
jgi:cytochrome c553